jgi:ankyrin repeat protein
MDHRADPHFLRFERLRALLFPDSDLHSWVSGVLERDEGELKSIRNLIEQNQFGQARQVMAHLEPRGAITESYWWAAAYLASVGGDPEEETRRCLHELSRLPEDESRRTLLVWNLLVKAGDAPPEPLASTVLGVIFESCEPGPTLFTTAAGYADGQLRLLSYPGGSIIGERWTAAEKQRAVRLVERGQEILPLVNRLETERRLPDPGTAHISLLTPGGTYGVVEDLDRLRGKPRHPFNALFNAAWDLMWVAGRFLAIMSGKKVSDPEEAAALFEAILVSDRERVELLLESGLSANLQVDGTPALAVAARNQQTEIVRTLVKHGANVNARATGGQDRETPILSFPAANGANEVLELLLEVEAVPDAADVTGATPLMCAAYMGHEKNVESLIRHRAGLECRDEAGFTALMFAAKGGRLPCAAALLRAGGDANARDKDGNPVLSFAAQHGHADLVELLLEAGADPSPRGTQGLSAMDLARQHGHQRVVNLLTSAGSGFDRKRRWWFGRRR